MTLLPLLSEEQSSALTQRLTSPDPRVRAAAFEDLGHLSDADRQQVAREVVSDLVFVDAEANSKQEVPLAQRVLTAIGRPAVAPLIAAMKRRQSYDYPAVAGERLAMALAGIGPAAEDAIPALMDIIRVKPKYESPDGLAVIAAAGNALGRIGGSAIEPLVTFLSTTSPGVDLIPNRSAAARALAAIGQATPRVKSVLQNLATSASEYAQVRDAAAESLEHLEEANPQPK